MAQEFEEILTRFEQCKFSLSSSLAAFETIQSRSEEKREEYRKSSRKVISKSQNEKTNNRS